MNSSHNIFFVVYKTVSGVNGPLVILDQVKVSNRLGIACFSKNP